MQVLSHATTARRIKKRYIVEEKSLITECLSLYTCCILLLRFSCKFLLVFRIINLYSRALVKLIFIVK